MNHIIHGIRYRACRHLRSSRMQISFRQLLSITVTARSSRQCGASSQRMRLSHWGASRLWLGSRRYILRSSSTENQQRPEHWPSQNDDDEVRRSPTLLHWMNRRRCPSTPKARSAREHQPQAYPRPWRLKLAPAALPYIWATNNSNRFSQVASRSQRSPQASTWTPLSSSRRIANRLRARSRERPTWVRQSRPSASSSGSLETKRREMSWTQKCTKCVLK